MNDLEKMKTNLELLRIEAAKAELEYKIAEREEEVKRLREHVIIQDTKILELKNRINK